MSIIIFGIDCVDDKILIVKQRHVNRRVERTELIQIWYVIRIVSLDAYFIHCDFIEYPQD